MTKFRLLGFSFFLALFIALTGCSSESDSSLHVENNTKKICPQCNMELPKSNLHTSKIDDDGDIHYFDDTGCMILWTKDNDIDLKSVNAKIYANDTKKYINAFEAFYKIDERTPMLYGFSAYEIECEGCIDFDEVIMRMLRGEHMANPKIRKQILGY